MIKPWIFEFLYAPSDEGGEAARLAPGVVYDKAIASVEAARPTGV